MMGMDAECQQRGPTLHPALHQLTYTVFFFNEQGVSQRPLLMDAKMALGALTGSISQWRVVGDTWEKGGRYQNE